MSLNHFAGPQHLPCEPKKPSVMKRPPSPEDSDSDDSPKSKSSVSAAAGVITPTPRNSLTPHADGASATPTGGAVASVASGGGGFTTGSGGSGGGATITIDAREWIRVNSELNSLHTQLAACQSQIKRLTETLISAQIIKS